MNVCSMLLMDLLMMLLVEITLPVDGPSLDQ